MILMLVLCICYYIYKMIYMGPIERCSLKYNRDRIYEFDNEF